MLLFTPFPSAMSQQAQIMQATATPLSELFHTPASPKRPSATSISSIFSSFGLKPHHRHPTTIGTNTRILKCTHLSVTRSHIPGSLPTPSYPRDLFLVRAETDKCCQRCHKPHYFRWVYVCNNCSARACHNCRPKWADRAWGSFGSLLDTEPLQQGGELAVVMVRDVWGSGGYRRQSAMETIRRAEKCQRNGTAACSQVRRS